MLFEGFVWLNKGDNSTTGARKVILKSKNKREISLGKNSA